MGVGVEVAMRMGARVGWEWGRGWGRVRVGVGGGGEGQRWMSTRIAHDENALPARARARGRAQIGRASEPGERGHTSRIRKKKRGRLCPCSKETSVSTPGLKKTLITRIFLLRTFIGTPGGSITNS